MHEIPPSLVIPDISVRFPDATSLAGWLVVWTWRGPSQ